MTPQEYQQAAQRTECNYNKAQQMLSGHRQQRLLHGAIGLCTESGELADALKKHIFYAQPLNTENVFEELGDILWYIAIICNEMNWPLEEVMAANIAKLKVRYPQKFTEHAAANRQLNLELDAVKGKL